MGGTNNTVQGNTIHDVDWSGGDDAGITLTGHNQQVLKNTIYNTGRDGILTSAATGGKIDHNTIHDIGTLTTDLGAIYTHGNVAPLTRKVASTRTWNHTPATTVVASRSVRDGEPSDST